MLIYLFAHISKMSKKNLWGRGNIQLPTFILLKKDATISIFIIDIDFNHYNKTEDIISERRIVCKFNFIFTKFTIMSLFSSFCHGS